MSETGHSEETTGFRRYMQLKISELQGQVSVLRTLIEKRVEQLEAEIPADSSNNGVKRRKISKLSKTGNGLISEIVERSSQTVEDARSLRAELRERISALSAHRESSRLLVREMRDSAPENLHRLTSSKPPNENGVSPPASGQAETNNSIIGNGRI